VHGAALVMQWIALIVGVLGFAHGIGTLARQQVVMPWMRGNVDWKLYGWSQALFGVFLAIETVPRITGAPDGLTLDLSMVAFVPMLAGVIFQLRARQGRT
jgi:hypothetical protein